MWKLNIFQFWTAQTKVLPFLMHVPQSYVMITETTHQLVCQAQPFCTDKHLNQLEQNTKAVLLPEVGLPLYIPTLTFDLAVKEWKWERLSYTFKRHTFLMRWIHTKMTTVSLWFLGHNCSYIYVTWLNGADSSNAAQMYWCVQSCKKKEKKSWIIFTLSKLNRKSQRTGISN